MTHHPAIRLQALTKVYEPSPRWMRVLTRAASKHRHVALDSVDLDVDAGTICAVVGPNGAGKSTMFRLLMGLTTPTSGSAEILGRDCSIRAESRHAPIGFMPADERSLFLRLSCYDNLAFQAGLRGYSGNRLKARVIETLEMVGLGHARDTAAFALSSGMKARLQLARAMVHEPNVLLLDEPTSTVDPVAADELLSLIKQLTVERSLAVMLSSHRLEEIDALDEMVVLLDDGKVVFQGDLSELRRIAVVTEMSIEFDSERGAVAALDDLSGASIVKDLRRVNHVLDVSANARVGSVLALLSDHMEEVVHVNERSSSTRELLREVYSRARPGSERS